MTARAAATVTASAAALLVAAGCGGGGGGITVPASDASPPEVSLLAGVANGPSSSVTAAGVPASLTLPAKTGPLNLSATARDPESGVQTVRVTVNKSVQDCAPPPTCSLQNPGLTTRPALESTGPSANPGATVSESSILATAIDLAQEIPQTPLAAGATRTVTFRLTATAVNHLGGRVTTPALTITWRE